jgi:PhoH-like ATPase
VATSAPRRSAQPTPAHSIDTARDLEGSRRRTYVLDTSVLLADPAALGRFAEHRVVLPVVVISELEAKRHHPELGYFARQALRHLDDLRIEYGRLDADLPVGDSGGTVRVELNHSDPSVLPAGFRLSDNDTRILSVARSLPSCPRSRAGPAWRSWRSARLRSASCMTGASWSARRRVTCRCTPDWC